MAIYSISLISWGIVMLFAFFIAAYNGISQTQFYAVYALSNALGSLIFVVLNDSLNALKPNNIKYNVTLKDWTFLSILVFGPFGLMLAAFIAAAVNDKPAKKFERALKLNEHLIPRASGELQYIDIADELKKQLYKEPVIDSIKSENLYKKRNAIEILSKMKGRKAVSILKEMASDKNFEIKFMAINKLSSIESEFTSELDWYKTAIRAYGATAELLFQYASVLLEFAQSGMLYRELAVMYAENASECFKAIGNIDAFKDHSRVLRARSLRTAGRTAEAIDLLSRSLLTLDANAVDELAACYFETGEMKEIKLIVNMVKKGELKCGPAVERFMGDKDAGESWRSGELYSVYNLSECVGLLKKCSTPEFYNSYMRLKTVSEPSMYIAMYREQFALDRSAKIIFLKLITGKIDPELASCLKYFLYCEDRLLNMLAANALTSSEFPLRNEIFADLIAHDVIEIRLIAVKFIGMKKLRRTLPALYRIIKDKNASSELKKEAVEAVANIDSTQSGPAIKKALSDAWPVVKISALAAIRRHNMVEFFDDAFAMMNSPVDEVRNEAALTAASFDEPRIVKKIMKFLEKDAGNLAAKKIIFLSMLDKKRPELIDMALSCDNANFEADERLALDNFITYIGRAHLAVYAKSVLSKSNEINDAAALEKLACVRTEFREELLDIIKNEKKQFYAHYIEAFKKAK